MKNKTPLILLIFISCSVPNINQKIELEKAIERFNTAFAESQTEILESMLTENYRHTNSSNKAIDKQSWLSYISRRNRKIINGELQVLEYSMDDLEIQMHGSSAHITGRITTKTSKIGIISENQYRVTHLWILENDQWKRAGFHDAKIK